MSKTISLKLSEENYKIFSEMAQGDNRSISNFIETAAKHHVERIILTGEFEMDEIRNNKDLNKSLKRGLADVKAKKGYYVC